MKRITDRQGQVLHAIIEYWIEHGYPPTTRELCQLLGVRSTHAIADTLELIQRKGALKMSGGKSRSIALAPEYMRYVVRGMARKWGVSLFEERRP